eukprot:jgi/Chlat1/558/Chrsp103S01133
MEYAGGRTGSVYPRVNSTSPAVAVPVRAAAAAAAAGGAGGVRVVMKPEYRMTITPDVRGDASQLGRSPSFRQPASLPVFDFDLERRVVAAAEALRDSTADIEGTHGQAGPAAVEGAEAMAQMPVTPHVSEQERVIAKYAQHGFRRQEVILALLAYGDNFEKVLSFCRHFNAIKEMGFSSPAVAGALMLYGEDRDAAITHLLETA